MMLTFSQANSELEQLRTANARLEEEKGSLVPKSHLDAKDEEISKLASEKAAASAAWTEEKSALVPKADVEAKETIIATLTTEKNEAVESLNKAKEQLDSQLTTLQQELEAEKANHGKTTGRLSSKDQEYSKLQEELDARGVEGEGHKTRISELEAVSHSCPPLTGCL
jgi:DNA repair exonuclease SbcCD ATPase subunit